MPSDIEIANSVPLKPIPAVASAAGILPEELELYGSYKAKVAPSVLGRVAGRPLGRYIDVTAITPTPFGEGKTTVSIGLSMGLARLGRSVFTCLRQPSLGPVFGIKGGAAGGGKAQVLPMEDINLHLTGDMHAVSFAHNLCTAYLNNALYRRRFPIDPRQTVFRYVMDVNERFLRNMVIGVGPGDDGIPLLSGFDITSASEIMSVLALADDLRDLRARLGRMVLAYTYDGEPVTADDVRVGGAMAAVLRDAVKPNLLQTTEHTPVLVHAGPFANIAHGNSSIIADRIAVHLAEYTITESGFGADMGMEKFMNIKCRRSRLVPNCVVVVASVRALKMHADRIPIIAGRPIPEELLRESTDMLDEGIPNLVKQVENARWFGVPVVVAVNRFAHDAERELDLVCRRALEAGAYAAVVCEAYEHGGNGAIALAQAVVRACEEPVNFRFLYEDTASIKEKIERIATVMYGAADVEYSPIAEEKIRLYERLGWATLPVCIAKTQYSLSHDPALKGRPQGFTLPIRDIRASVGAGFLYPLCSDIRTMPGLPSDPAGAHIDVDDTGRIVGMF